MDINKLQIDKIINKQALICGSLALMSLQICKTPDNIILITLSFCFDQDNKDKIIRILQIPTYTIRRMAVNVFLLYFDEKKNHMNVARRLSV